MKQILTTMLLAVVCLGLSAEGWQRLTVGLTDGSELAIGLSDDLTVTFDADDLVATDLHRTVRVPRTQIASFSHGTEPVTDGVSNPADGVSAMRRGNEMVFNGLPQDAEVAIFDMGGICMMHTRAQQGTCTLDLSTLTPGTYAVTASSITCKITVR